MAVSLNETLNSFRLLICLIFCLTNYNVTTSFLFANLGPLTISGVNNNGNNNDMNERATILGVVSGGYKSCKGMAVCGDVTSVLSWIKKSIE